jgi:acyl-CoA dehydrogenase
VPEDSGGAGLALRDVFPLLELCGHFAVPVPLAHTMLARALLAGAGVDAPRGSIAIARGTPAPAGGLRCAQAPFGRVAEWVLAARGESAVLLPVAQAQAEPGVFPLDATLAWSETAVAQARQVPGTHDLEALQACVAAAQIAGALMNVFQRTLQYANERQQFGRPIGKFQAIQHQLSVLSEHTFAARMAAQIGCHSASAAPERLRVAVGKARTSEAALEAAAIAHSIHGAIGFTAEYDLQLHTRRLHAWRQAAGSESYWHGVLGEALVDRQGLALDLIRATTDVH